LTIVHWSQLKEIRKKGSVAKSGEKRKKSR
jgi:hypothetical protein